MKKILIVDDSPTIRHMLKASLQTLASVALDEAASGLEAIEKIALAPVDLMLLDMNMPDMHGLDVLRFVRSHARAKQIPVVILTTKSDAETRQACLNAGATLFLTKPFDPNSILETISGLLNPTAVP